MALDKDTLIKVTNRNLGHVGYTVEDLGVRRQFNAGETKELTMEELRKLSYQAGGKRILEHYLIIEDAEATAELLGSVEPEYYYSTEDVQTLLNKGTIDQLADCLDFAPNGVIESVKDLAVSMKLNDVQKRKLIQEKTGFNVDKAIEINEETEQKAETVVKERRTAPITETAASRRTEIPEYKVTLINQ